jgi:pimeloyl-ACP methyl ester carboxylesterase
MTAENNAIPAAPNTIVLIHGLWMTPLSWEHWIDRYEARGFRVLAPAWPGMDGDIDELRRDPSGIEHLGIREIVDHYAAIIRELDRPPIIMGHFFGGEFTQILLDRGLGAAGVAIDSAAVKGVLRLLWSTLKSGFPVLKSPAALNESNARRYLESKAVTVYEEFSLRSHFTLGEKGWELVADYALTWAIENAGVCPVWR